MKKYYWVWLYQVKKGESYLRNSEIAFNIHTKPNAPITTMIDAPNYLDNIQIILVEKVFPCYVREVRTGIYFPILNIVNNVSYSHPPYHKVEHLFGKVHTFVFSKNNKLIGREVKSTKELEWYRREHPYAKVYKQELQDIITIGKTNVNDKINTLHERKIQEKQDKKIEQKLRNEEKIKVKKLIRQFKSDRKGI